MVILYWIALFVFPCAALVFAVLAWLQHKASWVASAAGALLVAIIIASLSSPQTPAIIAVLLTLIGVALAVIGGGPAATLILELATKGSVRDGEHGGILVKPGSDLRAWNSQGSNARGTETQSAPVTSAVHEVLRGGLTIGLLERLAVVGAILAGFPTAIAIIVAIKSVGRFSELDIAEARERFIIGTFASLIWACACAALVRLALG